MANSVVSARKHPVGNGYHNYPNGIWYGTLNGKDVTAPCSSQKAALAAARQAAENK